MQELEIYNLYLGPAVWESDDRVDLVISSSVQGWQLDVLLKRSGLRIELEDLELAKGD